MTAETMNDRKRWIALYVLCAGVLMIVIDATIVNVALPSIQDDLGFSQSNLAWVVNAYLIAFGGLLLLAGRMGDLIGQRRIFLIGLAVFTAASLLCAVSQSQGMLIAARFVQGVGGALTSAVILGMIVTMFPEPREQAKAIGVYGFVASAGGSIGLLAGGVLTEAINWHWIFFINIPVGIVTAFLAIRLVADSPGIGLKAGADLPGAVLLTGGLMLGVYTILQVSEQGWGSTRTLGLGAVSIALRRRLRRAPGAHRQPAHAAAPLPLAQRLGRQRRHRAARGRDVRDVLPGRAVPAADPGLLPARGRPGLPAVDRRHGHDVAEALRAAGDALRAEGDPAREPGLDRPRPAPLLADARSTPTYATQVMPATILIGIGAGLGFPSLMTLAMSGATPSDSGLASGLINTSVQVGGAIGLAVLATLASERTDALRASGDAVDAALNGGFHLAYLIGAALVASPIPVAADRAALEQPGRGGPPSRAARRASPREARVLRRVLSTIVACPINCTSPNPTRPTR